MTQIGGPVAEWRAGQTRAPGRTVVTRICNPMSQRRRVDLDGPLGARCADLRKARYDADLGAWSRASRLAATGPVGK
jgi:hypothetical protein